MWRKLVLGFTALAVAVAGAEDAKSAVEVLTDKSFDDFIKKNPVSLVKFMAPWCGHCKKLAPEFEAAAAALKEDGVPLAEVDATVETSLAEKYKVSGFPTIYLFRNGEPEPYSGGRTKDTIVDWIKKMTGPAVTMTDNEKAAMEEAAKVPVAFVGAFKTKDDMKSFEKVADVSRQHGKFIAYTGSKENAVYAVRTNEENTPTTVTTEAALKQFVADEALPLFGLIGAENYAAYAARASNWVWVAAAKEDSEKVAPALRKVSKNYRSEFNFVWLDVSQHKGHAEQALGLTTFPALAVVYEDIKYHYDGALTDMTEKSLTKFLQNVKAGKAPKFFKTEPVPEKNDEPVKVVVGSNFADMVLQKNKDVMLKIYAPWCGHCKKLAPIYEELAESLKDDDHIMITKLDGTANEITNADFGFQGFPTLYFVKAGEQKPIPYEGGRTLEDMQAFIKKHATQPPKMKAEEEKDEL